MGLEGPMSAVKPTQADDRQIDATTEQRLELQLRRSQALVREIASLVGGAVFVVDPSLRCLLAEGEVPTDEGSAPRKLEGRTLLEALGPERAAVLTPMIRRALAGDSFEVEQVDHGRHLVTRNVPLMNDAGSVYAALAVSHDISEVRQAERLVLAQNAALECVAAGRSLAECVEQLCAESAALGDDLRSAVLLIDEQREHFERIFGSQLDPGFSDAVSGCAIDDVRMGPCGSAMLEHRTVSCVDIENDLRWSVEWRALCRASDVRACHCVPVPDESGQAAGTFLMCFAQPRPATPAEERIAEFATRVLRVLVARERAQRATQRTLADVERGAAALKILQSVSLRLGKTLELEPMLQCVLDGAVAVSEAQRGTIQRLDSETSELRIVVQHGFEPSLLALFDRQPANAPSASSLAQQELARIVVQDVRNSPIYSGTPGLDVMLAAKSLAVVSTPIMGRSGQLLGVMSVYFDAPWHPDEHVLQRLDVLTRQAAETLDRATVKEQLAESAQRFQRMADAAPAMLWVVDEEGRCTFLSRGWYEYTGQAENEGLGFGWLRAVHADDRQRARDALLQAQVSRTPYQLQHRLQHRDGQYRWVIDAGRPEFSASGRYLGYIGSVMDIHEGKRAEDALRQADRRKDEFMATLAHELRNPLAPLRTGLQLLQMTKDRPEIQARAQDMMERQLSQMVRLIDDLMDSSRIRTGKIELRRQSVTLSSVLQQAVESAGPLVERLGHTLSVQIPLHPILLDADPARLAQVFGNLLDNAAKYTPRGGSIEIHAEASHDMVDVSIVDSGEGIPAHMLPKVFDLFIQGDQTLERSRGGLGIGLSLVRSLVELHGGRVQAFSDGPGRGSRFVVSLRAASPQAPAASAGPQSAPAIASGIRVLIADDNRDAAESLGELLELRGCDVALAGSGNEALEKGRQQKPHLVLLDIGMPGMNGFETARLMRQDPWGAASKLVALTGWGQPEDRSRSKDAGFDLHWVKPVPMQHLDDLLSALATAPLP
jgi:PAS domain S-box-containing protein